MSGAYYAIVNRTAGGGRCAKAAPVALDALERRLTFNRQSHHVHPDVDPATLYNFIRNHSSHLDHVAMYTATPHFKQGIELESHFDYPFYGWFMKARGTIPVPKDRAGALDAHLAATV